MKTVFLGDSLIFGYGVSRSNCWVTLAAKAIGITAVNRGINGDTTGGMLARFSADVRSENPSCVVLMGGVNDILSCGVSHGAKSNMMAMIHEALTYGIKPILSTPIPLVPEAASDAWGPFFNFRNARKESEEYARWLLGLGSAFGVPVCDFYTRFGALADESWYLDGLHPTKDGHRIMAELFCDAWRLAGI